MANESYFDADELDLESVLLAGFGLQAGMKSGEALSEGKADTTTPPTDAAMREQLMQGHLTHRLGQVGRLQVTFAFHHGDDHHK